MRSGHTADIVALLPSLFLMAGLWSCLADDVPPKRYPSAKAVFDAYREARTRRDHRTTFSLLTRELQDSAVFEAYFGCSIKESKETNAVLKRYGVDWETLTSDLRREYKAKHGVESADDKVLWDTLDKEYKEEHGVPPPSTHDLMSDILCRHLKDKNGFWEAALNVLLADHPGSPIGDLGQVIVQKDTATGRAAIPVPHYEMPPGEAPRKVEDKLEKTFRFRKVDGGWLLDSL